MLLLIAVILLAALVAGAAWGPGTHIQLTGELLAELERKKRRSESEDLVLKHRQPFLYGNIAADIINFKAYGGIKNHCHNWNIQERLEDLAESRAARAFLLGYLCHLSADIIAHNHFVPYHFVYNFPPRILGHAYWEAMADSKVSDEEWHRIDGLKRSRRIHSFDHMVHLAVRRKALGIRSNKWIFNNILLINCRQRWREVIRTVEKTARKHPLDEPFYRKCRQQSLRNMFSVFEPARLALLKARDPTGRAALQGAVRLRREILRDFGPRSKSRSVACQLAREAYGKLS